MRCKIAIESVTLQFREAAGTSRGVYTTRSLWIVRIYDMDAPWRCGIGECAPLPDLSCDFSSDYERELRGFCDRFELEGARVFEDMRDYPSMLFGLETAWLNMQRGSTALYDTPFARSEEGIPINGLVWMGDYETMLHRLRQKLDAGYRCVKLKIGAIDFDKELELMRIIRSECPAQKVELRVDANGAFSPQDALGKLVQLSHYDIHSIEQPIRAGQYAEMRRLCEISPIPIALDEELIGINSLDEKRHLLDTVRPHYIILKPSLHGGISGTEEWIGLARERGIGSWITSALESNIGLNAVAQLAAKLYGPDIKLPQGLGTGRLFTDNFDMPIQIIGDRLWYGAPNDNVEVMV